MKSWFSPKGGFDLSEGIRYRDFDIGNPECIHVVLSDRAYAAVIAQVLRDGRNETGGVFLGSVHNRIWYVADAVSVEPREDGGAFSWEGEAVRRQAAWNGALYRMPLRILGSWHLHPERMDYFSPEDERVLQAQPEGQLSMLVNVDPELRMTFYYSAGNEVMPVEYDYGDAYFLRELLEYAAPEELTARSGQALRVRPHRDMEPDQLPRSLRPLPEKEAPAAKKVLPAKQPVPECPAPLPPEASAAAAEALIRELMRRLEEAMARMPASYMVRLRDQNEQILAILEQLLREPPEPVRTVPARLSRADRAGPAAKGREVPSSSLPEEKAVPEEGEISGRINDLRVKYATEGGRRGWGV